MTIQKVAILGFGSWGGTISYHLHRRGYDVHAWHKFPEEIETMKQSGKHLLVPELVINPDVPLTDDMNSTLAQADMIVIAVPSHIVRLLLTEIKQQIPAEAILVNLAKGIENDSLLTMSQVIREESDIDIKRIVTLYGPSHAEEVAKKLPTTLVASCPALKTAKIVQHAFADETLRIYTNTDILGAEIAGSLKNVIAIAAGICDGIGFGDNTKAALITRGITEITRLGVTMGAQMDTFYGLTGIGDVVATCLSRHSRNRYVGEHIGRGETLDSILSGMSMVAEGVKTAESAQQLSEKFQVDMPITQAVYEVLFHNLDPRDAVRDLMTRDLRVEKPY